MSHQLEGEKRTSFPKLTLGVYLGWRREKEEG